MQGFRAAPFLKAKMMNTLYINRKNIDGEDRKSYNGGKNGERLEWESSLEPDYSQNKSGS